MAHRYPGPQGDWGGVEFPTPRARHSRVRRTNPNGEPNDKLAFSMGAVIGLVLDGGLSPTFDNRPITLLDLVLLAAIPVGCGVAGIIINRFTHAITK